MANEENQFDRIARLIDPEKNYDENCNIIRDAISSGKLDIDTIAQALVSSSIMPALAAENIKLRHELGVALCELDDLKKESKQEKSTSTNNVIRFNPNRGQVVN